MLKVTHIAPHADGSIITLEDGAQVKINVDKDYLLLRVNATQTSPVSETDLAVHYHHRMNMIEREWTQIQDVLKNTVFDSQLITDYLAMSYDQLQMLPQRVYAGGLSRNLLYLSRPVDFFGPWYTRSQNHYALLSDGDRHWRVKVNLNLSNITKIEQGTAPGHFLSR